MSCIDDRLIDENVESVQKMIKIGDKQLCKGINQWLVMIVMVVLLG